MFCPLGAMKLEVQEKKLLHLIQPSQDPTYIYFLLSRLLCITEGKYGNQLKKIRKFRDVFSSVSHETGSTGKKVTASDSAKPRPHIHIFFLIQGLRVRVEMGTKSEKVCMCVCM